MSNENLANNNKQHPMRSFKNLVLYLSLTVMMLFNQVSMACTICVKANENLILVGNNEDYYDSETKIWFFPESLESYGRVIWGYDRYLNNYQGGMNSQGLFIDINAVEFSGWVNDPEKPDLQGDYIEYILTHCATVDDVIKLSQEFDIDLGWIKLVVADAHGKSAIFEWLNNKVNIIERKGDFQVSTNYLSPKEDTEPRNQIASQILRSQKEPTIELIRKTLAATSYNVYFGQTLYSTICDLKNKKFYLYHFHYFEEVVIFNLMEELLKGKTSYKISSLFKIKTQNEYFFNKIGTQLGARDLSQIIDEEGIDKAIEKFYDLKEIKRTFYKYDFPEWRMRSLGFKYLSENKLHEAIGVLKLNTELYPRSTQALSDLADAHLKDKNKKLAIENYLKVLELNPHDSITLSIINKIKNE
jgi:penicillin V acylase-like amidase (Ntn superfamily)